jgi:hypothetical protein
MHVVWCVCCTSVWVCVCESLYVIVCVFLVRMIVGKRVVVEECVCVSARG